MKKKCIVSLAWLSLTYLTTLFFFSCTTNREAELRELHRKYMEASMNHDIETLITMTGENIVWHLGRHTLHGKVEALSPNEYDAGIENSIEYNNVVVRGDTVEFELVEKNEIAKVFGMDSVRHFPRFIFRDGLLLKRESWKTSADFEELNRRRKPFHIWVNTTHPEAMKTFFDPEKNFIFSRENGQLYVQLVREWQKENKNESGKP